MKPQFPGDIDEVLVGTIELLADGGSPRESGVIELKRQDAACPAPWPCDKEGFPCCGRIAAPVHNR